MLEVAKFELILDQLIEIGQDYALADKELMVTIDEEL